MILTMSKKKISWKITSYIIPLIFLSICLYFKYGPYSLKDDHLEIYTFKVEEGWGYKITKNEKTLIYQPNVPSLDSLKPFPDKESAYAIGALVLERIRHNKDFSISRDDLERVFKD